MSTDRWLVLLVVLCVQSPALGATPKSLAGVVHAAKAGRLPAAAKARLARDESVVVEGKEEHFFALYDRNLYEGIPSFISVDAILHVFHRRFDEAVAETEREIGLPALRAFAQGQLSQALRLLDQSAKADERWRLLALYHAIPLALLDDYAPGRESGAKPADPPPAYLDARLEPDLDRAVEAIVAAGGIGRVPGCDGELPLSLFKPRGHYAGWKLREYFRAFTFYGQCAFDLTSDAGIDRATDIVRLMEDDSRAALHTVADLAAVIVGPADDPGEAAIATHIPKAHPALPAPLTPGARKALLAGLAVLPSAKVRADLAPGGGPDRVFRLLGGGGVADSELFSRTAGSAQRPLPSVLDLLVKLGSADAAQLLAAERARSPALATALAAPWVLGKRSLYDRWLDLLARVVEAPAANHPSFEQTAAWRRHLTVAAAGSWAELRHDTLLYVKQPMVWAEGGDSRELPAAKAGGYVEPRPEVFRALDGLRLEVQRQLPQSEVTKGLTTLGDLLGFLVEVAELELANGPIPPAVDSRLREMGKELEQLSLGHGDALPPQAVVADVFTAVDQDSGERVLEVGIGDVDELWVVVPRGGKRVLMRGGVFAYYEFPVVGGQRLDDGDWLELLRGSKRPARPSWAEPLGVSKRKTAADRNDALKQRAD
jgi:hypothetical protein